MGQFGAFVKKEFLYIFRDTWTMIILLLLPILMVILFGYGISTETKNTRVAVFDPSRDILTQQIVNDLANSEYFIIDRYLTDLTDADKVFDQKVGLVLVFSENFNENMNRGGSSVQLITDASDPNTASTLTNYATAIINQSALSCRGKGNSAVPRISCDVKLLYNPTMKGSYNTVPGVLGLVMMLICTMMTSIAIAREKELGSMEVLLVSPIRPVTIILSKTVPYFVLSLMNFTSVMLISYFVLRVPVAGSIILLLGISMLYIFLCLSLGVLISIIAPSQVVAMLVSAVVMMLPSILLSGLMFPVENMPLVLQWFSQIIPAKWFIEAARAVMIQGATVGMVAKDLAVLGGMTVFLLSVSIMKFNKRIE